MNLTLAKLIDNPALAIASSVTLLLATVHTFVGSLGLGPFWSDSLVSLLVVFTTIYWGINLTTNRKPSDRVIGLHRQVKKKSGLRRIMTGIDSSIFVLLLLVGLFVWKAVVPINHLRNSSWNLCGTFVSSCPEKPCLELFDYQGRKLYDRCLYFDDDTGYKNLRPRNWWTYKPESFTVSCQGNTSAQTTIPQAMFDSSCEAKVDVP